MSEPEKKSKKEKAIKIGDFRQIFRAAIKTLKFAFKTSPRFTVAFIIVVLLLPLVPIGTRYINSKIIDELISVLGSNAQSLSILFKLVLGFVLLQITSNILGTLRSFTDYHLFTDFTREFDFLITSKFAEIEEGVREDPATNSLMLKVRENYGGRPMNFLDGIMSISRNLIEAIFSLVIIISFSPLFVVLAILSTFPTFASNLLFGKRKWSIWDEKSDIKKDYGETRGLLTSNQTYEENRVFGLKDFLFQRIKDIYIEFQKAQSEIENRRIGYSFVLDLIRVAGVSIALVILIMDVLNRVITVGSLSFYTATFTALQSAINDTFQRLSRIYEDGLFMVDIFTFLEIKNTIENGSVIINKGAQPPKIEIENLAFLYPGSTQPALNGISLTINPGDHIAIVGENGAGKSTLIKLLLRFFDPTGGSIKIEGTNLKDLNLDSYYKLIGTIFQHFTEYHFTAKLNIGIGDISKMEDEESVIEAAKRSKADDFIQKYKFKYDQILSKRFKEGIYPSVGQWQKIALARAFFRNAPILILDEPTSAIDPKSEFEIFENLFEFNKDKTVIIISHRFSTVRTAKRILVLNEGKVIEDGSHEDLMNMETGVYKTAFELQRKGYE